MAKSRLFTPISLRGFTSRNRIMVSPMCQYAATDGFANDYHLVHLGRLALGGAGIVVVEATAVEARGRISHGDLGLWSDEHTEPLRRIASFISEHGAVPAIQLAHAGRKGSTQKPWRGNGPLTEHDREYGEPAWPLIGPSAVSAGPGWPEPVELNEADLTGVVQCWSVAARRAAEAGFRIIDIHGAHGYLLHSFLSPIANRRTDRYGASFENRIRFPLEVVKAMRSVMPQDCGLFYRLSVVDGIDGGWTIEDSVAFSRVLFAHGVDLIDCSSGGVTSDRARDVRIHRDFGYHVPFARRIKRAAEGSVSVVGFIVDAHQAEVILQSDAADIVAVGREFLQDANWALHAQHALEGRSFEDWPKESGWWLARREPQLREMGNAGSSPARPNWVVPERHSGGSA
ncbi:NADH:flavin oxidoreductase/NADH oxidase [Mesorhizobium sp. M1329]|uniref:NADH:flavin oxidoreductase/NADH oxidase n=1 Tax=Mesorhizobium sp. M1329 TaxID=2957083 RepID=UPI00333C673F